MKKLIIRFHHISSWQRVKARPSIMRYPARLVQITPFLCGRATMTLRVTGWSNPVAPHRLSLNTTQKSQVAMRKGFCRGWKPYTLLRAYRSGSTRSFLIWSSSWTRKRRPESFRRLINPTPERKENWMKERRSRTYAVSKGFGRKINNCGRRTKREMKKIDANISRDFHEAMVIGCRKMIGRSSSAFGMIDNFWSRRGNHAKTEGQSLTKI